MRSSCIGTIRSSYADSSKTLHTPFYINSTNTSHSKPCKFTTNKPFKNEVLYLIATLANCKVTIQSDKEVSGEDTPKTQNRPLELGASSFQGFV